MDRCQQTEASTSASASASGEGIPDHVKVFFCDVLLACMNTESSVPVSDERCLCKIC